MRGLITYLLTSLFKYCNQGNSNLKNATSEIILTSNLTSNKVSLLKWERPTGDGKKIKQGSFFPSSYIFSSGYGATQQEKKSFFFGWTNVILFIAFLGTPFSNLEHSTNWDEIISEGALQFQ